MHYLTTFLPLALWAVGSEASLSSSPRDRRSLRSHDQDLARRDVAVTAPLVIRPITGQKNAIQKTTESIEQMANRLADALVNKYSIANGGEELSQRANNFNVVPAEATSGSNSEGVYQDGSDLTYFVDAELGSKQKSMYMLLDTGASTTWVMGDNCQSAACGIHNTFGPDDSSSYSDTGTGFSLNYGSGSVSGDLITDTMSIANLTVSMKFGVANVTSDDFKQFPFDGILGLSMNSESFLTALKNSGLVQANVFGVSLSREASGVNDGEIAFGGPNPAKYTGDITYTKTNTGGSWAIPLDNVAVNGAAAGATGMTAYIDTGTSFAFGPPSVVESIFSQIPGAKPTADDKLVWSVPCDAQADVAFTFSGANWTIPAKDLVIDAGGGNCQARLFGREVVKGAFLLGDVFLKNVYSVFDMDQARIGFAAKKATPDSTGTQPPSSSMAPPTNGTGMPASSYPIMPPTATASVGPGQTAGSSQQPSPPASQGSGHQLGCGGKMAAIMALLSVVAAMA